MKYDTLGDFLKYFLKSRDITAEYIANRTGKSKGAISHYISGNKNPSKDFIETFLKVFKLTKEERENFLLVAELGRTDFLKNEIKKYVKSEKQSSNVSDEIFESFIQIPLYGMASAGTGLIEDFIEEEGVKYISLPKLNGNIKKSDFATKVKGDSMEPYYFDGDVIVIDVSNPDIRLLNGKEALIYWNEEKYIKRVFFEEGTGNLILKSYNVAYPDIVIQNREVKDVECKGIISMVISMRNNKRI